MAADVRRFVRHCDTCQRNKASNSKPSGLLQPLPIPDNDPWQSVSMDFVVHLPRTERGHTAIIVFVDRLTKMTRLAACHDETSADDVARLFIENVFRSHGMPRYLLTDRDSQCNRRRAQDQNSIQESE